MNHQNSDYKILLVNNNFDQFIKVKEVIFYFFLRIGLLVLNFLSKSKCHMKRMLKNMHLKQLKPIKKMNMNQQLFTIW
jgi:hypothetical protein